MENQTLPLFVRVRLKQIALRGQMESQQTFENDMREAEAALAAMYGKPLPRVRHFKGSEHLLFEAVPAGYCLNARNEVEKIPTPVEETVTKKIFIDDIASVEDDIEQDAEETPELSVAELVAGATPEPIADFGEQETAIEEEDVETEIEDGESEVA
jgi:hypothetical protein